jgi:hypothetical protein
VVLTFVTFGHVTDAIIASRHRSGSMRVMHDGVPDGDTRIASSFVFADGNKTPSGDNGVGAWLRCARDWLRRVSGAVKLAV